MALTVQTDELCTVDGCTRPLSNRLRGLCNAHAVRLSRYGRLTRVREGEAKGRPAGRRPGVAQFVAAVTVNRDWVTRAACRDMDTNLFFPERGEQTATAKAACARCPVKADCLAAAFANMEQGVWGGTSARARERERSRLERESLAPRIRL